MRVKAVRQVTLPVAVPVYDVTVHGPENFQLYRGPFVHNSKDVADALAGVVWGLTTRRELWAQFGVATSLSQVRAQANSGVSSPLENIR